MTHLFSEHFQAVDANGAPLSGAKLYFYQTTTTTGITTYQDYAKGSTHAQPVVADTDGLFAPIYVDMNVYKAVLKTADETTIQTIDPIYAPLQLPVGIASWDALNTKGDDIATASSINLTTATGANLTLTGTDTVSSVTLAEGAFRFVRASGAFQLTASSSLVVNGSSSVNKTTTAGDLLLFLGSGSSVVRVWTIIASSTAATTAAAGIAEFATAAEFRTGTDTARALVVDQVWASAAEVTLTDATTITVDGATFLNAVVTLGGNRTLGTWSNPKVGQSGYIRVVQDGTGTRTLAFHADYEFAGGTAVVLSTAANAQDMLFYQVIASARILISAAKNIS